MLNSSKEYWLRVLLGFSSLLTLPLVLAVWGVTLIWLGLCKLPRRLLYVFYPFYLIGSLVLWLGDKYDERFDPAFQKASNLSRRDDESHKERF